MSGSFVPVYLELIGATHGCIYFRVSRSDVTLVQDDDLQVVAYRQDGARLTVFRNWAEAHRAVVDGAI